MLAGGSLGSCNATRISIGDWNEAFDFLGEKRGSIQIADQVGISHETIYRPSMLVKPLAAVFGTAKLPKEV